jgi:hypothetical protein
MSMVKVDKPIHQLTKDECLSILKYHVHAFGSTAVEYYSLKDSEILISIIDRLNEITEEIKPRILYVLTKKVPTSDYLSEIIPPDVLHLCIDDYKVDTTADRFYPELDAHDIAELIDSYAVLIGDNFVELFINDGNNKDYRNTVSNALKGLKEFYCTKIILYP